MKAQDNGVRGDVVWQVRFEGNETFSSMVLKDIIATGQPNILKKLFGRTGDYLLRETELRRDVIRIERYYRRRGFIDVEISHEIESGRKEWRKKITFKIDEGEPVRIRNVDIAFESSQSSENDIRGTRDFNRAVDRHEYQSGRRYQEIRSADVEGLFVRAMEEAGFAYASVAVSADIDSVAKLANVTILNIPGPKTYFEEIEIEGDRSVSDHIILRETELTQGDLYSRSKMQTAQRELFNHHLFRFATVSIPEQPQDSTLDIMIRIREYPLRSIEASVGVGWEEIVRGQFTWRHRNVGGRGHRFSATTRASFLEQRVGADYLVPYLFNTHSSFVSSPYLQHRLEPAYELYRIGFSNSLIYQYSPNLSSSVTYELTVNSSQQEAVLPDSVLNYNTASLTFSSYYNQGLTRRSGRGWVVQPILELSSLFGEGTFRFQKASLDVRRYTELTSSLVLANRIQGGAIFSTEQDSLPPNTRFYTGGTNTVRGWSRQNLGPKQAVFDNENRFDGYVPVGGRVLLSFNMELRQNLNFFINGLGIAAFLDGGQVWRALDQLQEREIQFGAGGGLRYQSPIGPLRIDIAYKLNPRDDDLGIYRGVDHGGTLRRIGIHFSIGQAF